MVTTQIDSSEYLLSSAKRGRASLAMATEQDERLIKLLTNGTEGQWVSSADIDWDRQPIVPEWISSSRYTAAVSQLYYGDSAIFVRRDVSKHLGGMRPIALMEDLNFVRRLEKFGPTVCIEDPPLITSSRRFEGRNPIFIVLGWLTTHILYRFDVSPETLAAIYNSSRSGLAMNQNRGNEVGPGLSRSVD